MINKVFRGYSSLDSGAVVHIWLYERNKNAFNRLYDAKNSALKRIIKLTPAFSAKVSSCTPRTGFGEGVFLIDLVDIEERSWFTIAVNKRTSLNSPDLVLRFNYPACRRSDTLTTLYRPIIEKLFSAEIKKERLSRVDVSCTINDSAERLINKFLAREYISHLRVDNVRVWGKPAETMVCGNRDWVRFCIYDKVKELRSSPGKDLKIQDIIEVFHDEDEVCRIEFNLSRQLLYEFNINTVEEFNAQKKLVGAWLSRKFFRFVEKYDRSNQTKQKIDPAWLFCQTLLSDNVYYVRLPRIRDKRKFFDVQRLTSVASGLFSSIAAQAPGGCRHNFRILVKLLQMKENEIVERAKFKRRELCERFSLC